MGFDKFLFVLLAILPVITRTAAEYAPLLKQLSPKSSLQSTNFLANTITFVYRIELPQECENVDNSGSSFYVCLQLDGVVIQCAEVKDKDEPSFELASLVPGAHTAVGVVINSLDSHTPLASTIPYEITVVTPDTCKHRAITPLVFDAFIFSNELDLLELRLNELNDVVDYFVIVESDYTFRNKEKMLVWDQSKGEPRFERFSHKIIHYIHKSSQSDIAWENEYSQRDAMYDAVVQSERSNGDDILIIADLDEIPRSSAVKSIAKCEDAHLPITLETNFHYYNFNWVKPQSWRAPQAYRVREAASVRPSELRRALGYRGGEREDDNFDEGLDLTFPAITKLENAGWHASYFFDDHGEIAAKISSFSHSEFDKDEIKSNIAERVKSGKDLFGRVEEDLIFVEEPDLPVFLNEWQWNKAANRLRERFVISDRVASDVARNANEWEASFNRIGSEAIGGFRRGCSIGLSSPPAFFIGIISAIGNAERRQVIRDTWLSHPELELYKAKEMVEYAFFLGLEDDGLVGEDAQREADEHGDIVFINKRDTYHNMPYKAVGIMRFGVRECGSSYIMRSNDDVYLRFGVVLEDLFNRVPARIYGGQFVEDVKVLRPVDEWNPANKKSSAISRAVYPSDVFPTFAQGNAYILSLDLAEKVAEIGDAKSFGWYRFKLFADDVMVGLVMEAEGANRLQIDADFRFDGANSQCSNENYFQFNVDLVSMRTIFDNDVEGRPHCHNVLEMCCG